MNTARRGFLGLLASLPFCGFLAPKAYTVEKIEQLPLRTKGPLLAFGTTLLGASVNSMTVFDKNERPYDRSVSGHISYCGQDSFKAFQHARFNVVGILVDLGHDIDFESLRINASQNVYGKIVDVHFTCKSKLMENNSAKEVRS